jgi:hypothetical protein
MMNTNPRKHDEAKKTTGSHDRLPAFHPGGMPRVMRGCATAESEVLTIPDSSVVVTATREGAGETVGSDVTFVTEVPKMALYVFVASSEDTTSPAGASTDALKMYGGAMGVGVAIGKFGSVVVTVADMEEKKSEIGLDEWVPF